MSEPPSSPLSPLAPPPPAPSAARSPLQLVRIPVDKSQPAVAFLHARSRGVMDLIAHFWEGLARTPPLLRQDLHLVVASRDESQYVNINIAQLDPASFSGAMLYVPKAHRADVLALDPPTAAAFAAYISHQGPRFLPANGTASSASRPPAPESPAPEPPPPDDEIPLLPLTDLSLRNGTNTLPAEPQPAPKPSAGSGGAGGGAGGGSRVPIDFLTGDAEGIAWMTPLLLPLVHKRTPARQLVNVVMQLPENQPAAPDPHVRLARDTDIPQLNRWRRLYKEERGIVFDADMGALIDHQRVFVCEVDAQIVAVAKIDLDLANLVEIGGVYTFPEFRKRGYGAGIVRDLAARIRLQGKVPTLQVDVENTPALQLYEKAGWRPMGKLARVWLTG